MLVPDNCYLVQPIKDYKHPEVLCGSADYSSATADENLVTCMDCAAILELADGRWDDTDLRQ